MNGVSLRYIDEGAGTPLLCLHGAFADHRNWDPQREALAPHLRFIAYDQRYFGPDPWPDDGARYSLETHASDLAAFIRQLDAGPVHVAARSYGANVALVAALRHPGLFRALLVQEPQLPSLVSDPADRALLATEREGLVQVRESLAAGDADAATRRFYDWVNGADGAFGELPEATQAWHLANGRTIALHFGAPPGPPIGAAELARLRVPLTVTRGEFTRPFMRVCAVAVHRAVPGSGLIVIPGARHAASAQNPGAFSRALRDFVTATPA